MQPRATPGVNALKKNERSPHREVKSQVPHLERKSGLAGGHCSRRETQRVAGGGAKRHLRNAVQKTAHPAEGWQRICWWSLARPAGVPSRGGRPSGGVASLNRRLLSGMASGIGSSLARRRGKGTHKFLECVAKLRALFPGGTERVYGGGAKRHPRNAAPKTAHPAEGW